MAGLGFLLAVALAEPLWCCAAQALLSPAAVAVEAVAVAAEAVVVVAMAVVASSAGASHLAPRSTPGGSLRQPLVCHWPCRGVVVPPPPALGRHSSWGQVWDPFCATNKLFPTRATPC